MPHAASTEPILSATISFIGEGERVIAGVVWDVMDYQFRVSRGTDHCVIAVGIVGDWQDRLSRSELQKLAETWLVHRLEHGYEPFKDPRPRLTQVPCTIVDYWLAHRALPH